MFQSRYKLVSIFILLGLAALVGLTLYTWYPKTQGITGPLTDWLCLVMIGLSVRVSVYALARRRTYAYQRQVITPRRITQADSRDVFHQQITIYQREMDKVKQGYAVWPPHASKDEMLKCLDDYLCGRPVQWYKQHE